MIRWALAEIRSPCGSTPRRRSASISSVRTRGSMTTPLPITHVLPGYRMPDGTRWNFHSSPLRTIVWPALLPPWKRITAAACSASRSVTLPLPSSPHWAPTITIDGICRPVYAGEAPGRPSDRAGVVVCDSPLVLAEEKLPIAADFLEPGNGALADLLAQLLVSQIGCDDERALRFVAGVDDRVELFEHPLDRALSALLGDAEQVNALDAV